jgi:hypothetical protein
LVVSHGVIPLVYWNLKEIDPEAVPESVLAQLKGVFQANATRNLFLTQELLNLLALFAEKKIAVLPIKGPVLTAMVYGNLAFRSFCDLDLLVREQDVLLARELLFARGYQPHGQLGTSREATYVRSHRAFNFDRADGQAAVDLQWRLAVHWQMRASVRLDLDSLWKRMVPFKVAGTRVSSPSPEDLLLILCMHGSNHGWRELKQTCDVAELIRRYPDLDWEELVTRAKALGMVRVLYLGLRLAQDLLGAELPESLEKVIRADRVVGILVAQARDWMFGPRRVPVHLFQEAAFYVRTGDRLWDRLRYILFYLWAYVRPRLRLAPKPPSTESAQA